MNDAKHTRESAAKSDDQIALENGISFQNAGRLVTALEWFADVKPTGGRLDIQASSARMSLLIGLKRAEEAVDVGTRALKRTRHYSVSLVNQTSRALNVVQGPLPALNLCRQALRHAAFQRSPHLWFSAAAYASQCHQFGRSLRYLRGFFDCCDESFGGDLFSDFDFAPLWQHLRSDALTDEENAALRTLAAHRRLSVVVGLRCPLSYESIGHVPPGLRRFLCLNLGTMNWVPRPDASPAQQATFQTWCEAVRQESRQSFEHAMSKALANHTATSGECA
ncbi:hypothetical protein [Prosthecobacter sp.]|jgi:hypothetical protein|uniref:hypothetical protein n=1 Tax=Prosthecobacter sp. TaxID=1965333 RepID=UPI0037839F8C